jgi:Uma2 family endonuclease
MVATAIQASKNFISEGMTARGFLEWERKQRVRHEFIDGKIYTMSGASRKHNKITFNLNGLLWFIQQSLDNFEAFSTDMRTYAPYKGAYFYPDIVMIKGKDQYLDDEFDTLINPTVVFEVASKSTKQFDKSKKFEHYRSIPTLEEYFLIAQNEYHITHFYKIKTGEWVVGDILRDPNSKIKMRALPIELKVSDIYRGVDFKSKR